MGRKNSTAFTVNRSGQPNYETLDSISQEDDLIDVETLIARLQELPRGSRICITQDGNYAEGDLAYIFSNPLKICDTDNIFSIGHSDQTM